MLALPPVEVRTANARVTVTASDVPVSTVLLAWAEAGHLEVVGVENLGARRVSIHLTNTPEADALTAILGSTAWYTTVAREAPSGTESVFSRIVILREALTAGGTGDGALPRAGEPESIYRYSAATQTAPDEVHLLPPPGAEALQPAFPTSGAEPETVYNYSPTRDLPDPIVQSAFVPETPALDPEVRFHYSPATLESPPDLERLMGGIPSLRIFSGFTGLLSLPGRVIYHVYEVRR